MKIGPNERDSLDGDGALQGPAYERVADDHGNTSFESVDDATSVNLSDDQRARFEASHGTDAKLAWYLVREEERPWMNNTAVVVYKCLYATYAKPVALAL